MTEQPIIPLLAAIQEHLTTHDLPTVVSIRTTITPHGLSIQVAHSGGTPAELASVLLAWTDTLTGDITGEIWRTPDNSVHLSVFGTLPVGTQVSLFGGVPDTAGGPGAGLEPGQHVTVALNVLREITGGSS